MYYSIVTMIKNLIQQLLDAGLTQAEIARKANVPQPRISDIANGKQATINYEAGKRLERLATELNIAH